MKKLHKIIAASLLAASAINGSNVVIAESSLTGNASATSNYIWRGVTQTNDDAAVSGGVDYSHATGIFFGAWNSSIGGGNQYEQDIYGGYAFTAGPVDIQAGLTRYIYPIGAATSDFGEVFVNATYSLFNAGVAITTDKESAATAQDVYINVGAELELKKGLNLAATIGNNSGKGGNATYSHVNISILKNDFTFAIDKNSLAGAAGDPRISVTWGQSFDL